MRTGIATLLFLFMSTSAAREVSFATPPFASQLRAGARIVFAVDAPVDVEVAILAADGRVARHLAAGVLGGKQLPPAPLGPGLSQSLEWDGQDDLGKPAQGGPFQVRVRAGMGVKFGRFIGGDPYTSGAPDSLATDADGNLYLLFFSGAINQRHMNLRMYDAEGRYVREVMPFPANLAPEAMKDVARWDRDLKTFYPQNKRSDNPSFYENDSRMPLRLVKASRSNGILLCDGARLYALDSNGAVRGSSFLYQHLWPKDGVIKNSGCEGVGGPAMFACSMDGQVLYLSGPFSAKNRYGYTFDSRFPPGAVYRMKLDGQSTLARFTVIPVDHRDGEGGAWARNTQCAQHWGTRQHGPVHQTAVDAKGNVYVADREHDRVAVYSDSGQETGAIPVRYPHLIAVHPKSGALYVLQHDCVHYGKFLKVLLKFDRVNQDAQPVAKYDFGLEGGAPSMAVAASMNKTLVWVAGAGEGLVALEDKGTSLERVKTAFAPQPEAQVDWNRMSVDYGRDEIYVNNGGTLVWRYNGQTGLGGIVKRDGKPVPVLDLSIGYDGLIYARLGGTFGSSPFSGSLERFDRDFNPAPYPGTGTHVLSKYIFGRMGIGYSEHGVGVGPCGEVYCCMMYAWHKYCVIGFGTDGKPLHGNYLKGIAPGKGEAGRGGYPQELDSAIIGPVPTANGGVRVDLQGHIYLGIRELPKDDFMPPQALAKDPAYPVMTGSIVKFGPQGGSALGYDGARSVRSDAPRIAMTGKRTQTPTQGKGETLIEGALKVYSGIAPFSGSGFGMSDNLDCVCRTPRFEVDRYGRLAFPNAASNSVVVLDNAGNKILEFGKYGNFDSQYVSGVEKDGKPRVASPEIPLGWPTGVGCSENHLYVNDTYNRRAVRVDLVYAIEALCSTGR